MPRSFDESKELFLRALASANWNDVAIHATELLQIDENIPWAWANRGVALNRLGHPLDAILNYDRALAIEESAISYSNKGAAYWDMEKSEEAIRYFTKAIRLDPSIPQTHMNVGHVHKWLGETDAAIAAYRKAIKVDPTYADGHLALGVLLLRAGQLKEGWEKYEWRWKTDQLASRGFKLPQWNGEDLTRKTILIYAEQGLGDILQFARYARILGNRYPQCKVIIEGRQPVKRLLETIPEIYATINYGERVPVVDYVIPMLTLAGMLTPDMGQIPASDNEYILDISDVETWEERLAALPEGFRVGVCWAGMARTAHTSALKIDSLRSTNLDTFAPLAKIPGIIWVSLQKGPSAEQVKAPPVGMTIGDFTEEMYDFYETCCAIENCDLVISVDTAVVHAAASIGKPTWLLSRWDGCWRWHGDGADSPWYPSLRQFVQPAPHDWDGMMKNVAKELSLLVRNKNQEELNLTMAK